MGKLYTSPEVTVIQTESPTIISGSGRYKLEKKRGTRGCKRCTGKIL